MMNQREAFENWHKGMYGPVRSRRDGNYLEPEQGRWLAWSTSRSVLVEEVERVVTPAMTEAISRFELLGRQRDRVDIDLGAGAKGLRVALAFVYDATRPSEDV
ncbi:hypothetical protein [Caballeronia sp. LZ001]|uniref:hypothetical protein n=1 Tax=Caballeronia sp. LZ001 TaxID=3038553 RepID=UPI00285A3661|nr:hypothetical protein [Caballeronia sp. LZ001]MDR5799015.1 hypothetical protein [Caballeronia sp. LZ001]